MAINLQSAPLSPKAKRSLWVFAIFIVAMALISNGDQPCSKPITYRIGGIDPRFNLSAESAQAIIGKSTSLWDVATNKQLLQFDPQGEVAIYFTYDDRQAFVDKQKSLVPKIDAEGKAIDSATSKLNSLRSQYDQLSKQYNYDVSYWNARGGAPTYTYNQIENERTRINSLVDQINSTADSGNQKIAEYNDDITVGNSKAGTVDNVGIYKVDQQTGYKSITIYEYSNLNELESTMTHEMGHALGIDHLSSPDAIMAAVSTKEVTVEPVLTTDDIAAIKSVCKIDN